MQPVSPLASNPAFDHGPPFRSGIVRATAVVLLLAAALCGRVEAGAIVVGRSGSAGNCTVPSIQAAIDRANGFGGYNLILVTDDVPDGVYHENVRMDGLREDLALEIVGGFDNCADLVPTGGKASIYGGGTNAPVLAIEDRVDLRMRNFWLEGGTQGIHAKARGRVELTGVTINNNEQHGLLVEAPQSPLWVDLLGNVQISANAADGLNAIGQVMLTIRGDGNTMRANEGAGMRLRGSVGIDIGATGDLLDHNGGFGLDIDALAAGSAVLARLYATVGPHPLRIVGNAGGGISMRATESPYRLCTRNIAITDNGNRPIHVAGPGAVFEMNTACGFPAEAEFACGPSLGWCNAIDDNHAAAGKPLVAAVSGGSILLDRVHIAENSASSILSTNLGSASSLSAITLTTSVVNRNILRDNLFESLNGGVVDIRDSTVNRNTGDFPLSLVGINPGLLQVTNSIIDQPQALLDSQGEPSATRITRVLAPNDLGTGPDDEVLLGRPTYYFPEVSYLDVTSLGVDYAPDGGGTDLGGRPRDVDTIGIPNQHGPRDLGAFESQVTEYIIDRLFEDGFD